MRRGSRREFLRGVVATGVSALAIRNVYAQRREKSVKNKQLNIIIIITHDTGRHLGCYGRSVISQNLDRIAEEGVKFSNAFCTAPQCSPSRASLLSGLMPHRHGLIGLAHRGFRLRQDLVLLPKLLSENGYITHLFGLQHETQWDRVSELGYQHVHRPGGLSCAKVTPFLLKFLESNPQQPFFAMVGFFETHRPFPKAITPLENVKVPEFLPDVAEVRQDIADLNESVRRVDESVGQIIEALKKARLLDNTLVIFTTDHGIAFPGAKATLFDPGIEIALLMRGPDEFNGGKVINAIVSNADLMPTICEIAGIEPPNGLDGKSLLPLLRNKVDKIHEHLFVELTYHAAYDPMRGIRTEEFKYIRSFSRRPFWLPPNVDNGLAKDWYRKNQSEVFQTLRPKEMLFDLIKDPLERKNVADDRAYEDVLKKLRKLVEQRMQIANDPLIYGHVMPPEGARVTPSKVWGPEEGVTDNYDPRLDEWGEISEELENLRG
ncbi:MAG: sulfatase [Armatimonadetes bacterium]|nr:sulfatase [Armatimonadota bacterium]